MKIIFLTNAAEKDKKGFIQENYKDEGKFFFLHSEQRMESGVFGDNWDFSPQLVGELVESGVQSLLLGYDLVVDYANEKNEIDLKILLHSAQNIGLKTQVIDFRCESKIMPAKESIDSKSWNRVIRTIISNYAQNIGIEEICVLGGKNTLIKFYKYEYIKGVIFYYATNEKCILKHSHDFELNSNEKTVEEFMSFQEAFENIQMRYGFFQLYPLRINEKYTSEFNNAYQKYMKSYKTDFKVLEWQEFLN